MKEGVRLNLIFGKQFFGHLKKRKEVFWAALILIMAVVFILMGTRSNEEKISTDASLEDRVAELCKSIDGVGKCKVLIYYKEQSSKYDTQKVESIVVVCEGGDSVEIRRCLTEMLSSFFGIGTNRVRIEKMKK